MHAYVLQTVVSIEWCSNADMPVSLVRLNANTSTGICLLAIIPACELCWVHGNRHVFLLLLQDNEDSYGEAPNSPTGSINQCSQEVGMGGMRGHHCSGSPHNALHLPIVYTSIALLLLHVAWWTLHGIQSQCCRCVCSHDV